jgi:hypothetical protein
VESGHQVIVTVSVSYQQPDAEHMEPMPSAIRELMRASPLAVSCTASHHYRNAARSAEMPRPKLTLLETQKYEGIQDRRPAQSDSGAGEWSDQGSLSPTPLSATGPGEGRRQMASDRSHTQPAIAEGFSEGVVVAVQAMPSVGSDGIDGIMGGGHGLTGRGDIRPHRRSSTSQPLVLPNSSLVVLPLLPVATGDKPLALTALLLSIALCLFP